MAYPAHQAWPGCLIPFGGSLSSADPTTKVIVILVLVVLATHGYPWAT